MPWTNIKTMAVGDPVVSADWNTYVRDSMSYLKGQAGAVTIEDEIVISHSSNDANLMLRHTGSTQGKVYATSSGIGLWDSVNSANILFNQFSPVAVRLGADSLPPMLHPYTYQRHLEWGSTNSVGAGTGKPTVVSFTKTFSATPNFQWCETATLSPDFQAITALSSTGFTWTNTENGVTHTIQWLAMGQDT